MEWNCHECGSAQTVHVSHPDVQYNAPHDVLTPVCQECLARGVSARISLKTHFTEAELAPPQISYHPDGSIADCVKVGAPNFTEVKTHYELRPDGMGNSARVRVIDAVIHPVAWVTHHQNLVGHMQRHGKVYTPPEQVPQEPMVPLSQVKEIVQSLLQQYGINKVTE